MRYIEEGGITRDGILTRLYVRQEFRTLFLKDLAERIVILEHDIILLHEVIVEKLSG